MSPDSTTVTVESYVPGRMRLRVPRGLEVATVIAGIVATVEVVRGITHVASSAVTGSVLLNFDPEVIEIAEIVAILETANVVLDLGLHAGKAAMKLVEATAGPTLSQAAHQELSVLNAADSALHRATGGAAGARPLLWFAVIALAAVGIKHGWFMPEKLMEALKG